MLLNILAISRYMRNPNITLTTEYVYSNLYIVHFGSSYIEKVPIFWGRQPSLICSIMMLPQMFPIYNFCY